MRITKAVAPYIYDGLNFKDKAFKGWKDAGFATTKGFYPRFLHGVLFRHDIFPTLWKGEARLVFVQPVSMYFDASVHVISHEIIPFIWDCWPCYYDMTERWLKRHRIKTAIFTSSQEMREMQRRIPDLDAIHCPEAIDTELYKKGADLNERSIDILEFGRSNYRILNICPDNALKHIDTSTISPRVTDDAFINLLSDSKVAVCFPKSITHPDIAQGVETLTQRYWEAMASRCILWGHCPKELSDFIGYNPVIEYENDCQLQDMLSNTEKYQALVDKNRHTALQSGDWKTRMKHLHDKICISKTRH